ncbi:amino acid/polyamine/organocation transporter (APC superfamily) [Prauserella shujinwangii]|uniref:Amino acid/polyamine/organocation transporter (APC superfamily) n=1 Tax=Prauserella shujinwangii TaxID=1453103 RepID=A0A2T0LZ29_9PSEU|nr:amino acid/polyamine/organocation transporter (APC superfamily) [Prauserella shujinwangii]
MFLVLAAVAPLTGIIVIGGIGIAVGAGGGTPMMFLLATAVFLLFAVGYAQMAKKLVNAGGFYAYVVRGLGRTAGVVAAFVAMVGYNCFVAGAVGTSGFFTSIVFADVFGLDLPWWLWSLISVAGVWLLTRSGIDISAKVLGVALVLEVSILIILDIAILFTTGYSFEPFLPEVFLGGSIGLGLLFAANAFVGFEATGLFSEEARDPKRTIPRATYVAITFIGIFAAVTTWAIVSALGAREAGDIALEHLAAGDLVFTVSAEYLGGGMTDAMQLLLVVSLFAALLALHNSATRYLYALGRTGVLPRPLARTRRSNGAPVVASTTQLTFATLVAMAYAVTGLDPIANLVAAFTGIGTLGIVVLQAIAATAIVVHFRRVRDPRWLPTFVLPLLGGLGLWAVTALAFGNFPELAGSDSPIIALLPWLLPVAAVLAVLVALWLRGSRPAVWAALDQDLDRVAHLPAATEVSQ